MGATLQLLRHERRARVFFLAHGQSALGTGTGYVALLVLAYDRFASPWAISLVLLADFLPPMLLGPLFGAAADRWPRRRCAICADVARALAFIGIGLTGGFGATLALALFAGAGTALFQPAVLAALPGLVREERRSAATSVYGALDDFGHTLGPVLAAAALLIISPEALVVANGLTFALSALLISRLSFGERRSTAADSDSRPAGGRSLLQEAREGMVATSRMPGVRTVVLASSAVVLFAGLFNVGELLLATTVLGAGASGFSLLVAVFGLGVIVGSLAGARGGNLAHLKRHYLTGLFVVGLGFLATGLAPVYGVALVTFWLGGLGNGLVVVHERLLLQRVVGDSIMARVFAVKNTLTSWAFAAAFLLAGGIASAVGPRPLFVLAGGGAIAVWAVAATALRRTWTVERPAEPERTPVLAPRVGGALAELERPRLAA
jgi:MFS family permease